MSNTITIRDLSHGLTTYTKVCNRIYKVGIELEGNFQLIPFFKGHFTSDSSVVGFNHLSDNYCTCPYHECRCTQEMGKSGIGEWVSNKLDVSEIEEFINKCHPIGTNSHCGGHIHVSLKSACDYMTLMSTEFYEYTLKRMNEWGTKNHIRANSPFWDRVSQNGTEYNWHRFNCESQRDMTRNLMSERYSQLNYCYNNQQRKTLEFRLLPTFKSKKLQISATLEIIQIIEDYLELKGEIKTMTFRGST